MDIYKATFLKNILKDKPLRTQKTLMLSMSMICYQLGIHWLSVAQGSRMKIFSGDNEIDHIPQANVTQSATKVEVRSLQMIANENNLFWTGRYSSSSFRVSGGGCLSIEPQISRQPPKGCSSYYFNNKLIQDIGVHIVLSGQNNDTDEGTKCKICKRRVQLKDMRVHVGKHVIKNDITGEQDDICGFCGKHGCTVLLESTSHKGSKKYFSPKSNCVYFYPYKKVGDTPTRNNPCTNKIVTCKICNVYTWKYNLKHHFQKTKTVGKKWYTEGEILDAKSKNIDLLTYLKLYIGLYI